MGGFGSGRFGRRSGRALDREMVRVSLADLRRSGFFNPVAGLPIRLVAGIELSGREGIQSVRLLIGVASQQDSEALHEERLVLQLVISPQPFGGHRVWFECPRAYCRRQCAVVYRPVQLGSRAFACRSCTRFRYVTQSLNEGYRYERRAERVMRRLNRSADGTLLRPRGMTVKTYERLVSEIKSFMLESAKAPPYFPMLPATFRANRP